MATSSLYRRSLPSPPAVDFSSPEGKKIFNEALQTGTMEGFFRLISYFQTQSEPAYCGLASLAVVLNALSIDPGRKWKGPWRWFDESMLECCESLEVVKEKGISFGKLVCLAQCSGAKVEAFCTKECLSRFMLISRPHKEPGLLYTLSCKDESWISIAKYLKEDVPRLVSSQHVDSVEKILSVVFKSLPSHFNQFIRWVAEIRITENANQHLSAEEKSRLNIKKMVLKEVRETELFKYISKFFSSVGYEVNLTYLAAKACCQGAGILSGCSSKEYYCHEICLKCAKGPGEVEGTVVTGVVGRDGSEQNVNLLVPSTQTDCECGPEANYPAGNDVFTVLLLALPTQTWSGIKHQALMHEMKQLISIASLPTILQEEVLHLQRQLQLLKRCQENREEEDFAAPAY
ncbi:hypothetical protein Bca4012_060640 [Brassica carinata]